MKWTSFNDLREKYLSFFESKGHLRLNSFSLVPNNDKSLLLINSGMAPMKKYFTGEVTPPSKRVTTCQKCIRTPDLERVGHTARHGTYFEMLGNFSFGDYFKEQAIPWAWEFLTKVLEIPENLLWPSVYEEDDEAYAYIIHTDKDYLFISESTVVQTDRRIEFTGTDSPSFKVYPDYKNNYHKTGMQGVFTEYQKEINRYSVEAKLSKTEKGYKINISYPNCIANEDIILCIDYIGDKGMLYMDHELVMDQYCNGNCLKVNLNDLNLPEELDFEITPISEDNPVYIEVPIEYNNGKAVYVNRVFSEIYYKNYIDIY